ncbi:MAG: hypothetical protein DWP94_07305 [Flavobacterium sp.]|nr:MAG: hypothetical protein DWP94_07305 [Flavobacterium sp.]
MSTLQLEARYHTKLKFPETGSSSSESTNFLSAVVINSSQLAIIDACKNIIEVIDVFESGKSPGFSLDDYASGKYFVQLSNEVKTIIKCAS